MGREIRRVAPNWQHPKNADGHYIPLHESFPYNAEEIIEGLRDGWLKDEPPFYGIEIMPQWPEAERTHYQMYENVSEGTPVTPPFSTKEALIEYLVEHGDFSRRKGYDRRTAEAFVAYGYAPSMVISDGKILMGIESSDIAERRSEDPPLQK